MPVQRVVLSQNEIPGNYSSQMEIAAPQPVNLAALHRLHAILEIQEISLATGNGLIAVGDISTRKATSNLDILAPDASAVSSHDMAVPHNSTKYVSTPVTSTIDPPDIHVEPQPGKSQTPEQVVFWQGVKRYLNDQGFPIQETVCINCRNVKLVLDYQSTEDDVSSDREKYIVLPCGHFIGDVCFVEMIRNHHRESIQYWQDECREFWFMPAVCLLCRKGLECGRCGQRYRSACLAAFVRDQLPGVSSILKSFAGTSDICEDCSADLGD